MDAFFFAPAEAPAVRMFRIALAGMLAFVFWPRGSGPAAKVLRHPVLAELYESIVMTPTYWGVILVVLALFAIGWHSRLGAVLLFLLLFPLNHLERGIQSGHVMLVALGCFAWLRSGERALRTTGPGPIWPIQLIRLQLTFVYALNALWKSTPHYLSGDALVGMSERLPNFIASFSDGYWHVGPLAIPVAVAAVASTLTEAFLAVGFWFPRTRRYAVVAGVAFHLVLQQIVRIFMLDLATMFLYLAFLLPFTPRAAAMPNPRSDRGIEP